MSQRHDPGQAINRRRILSSVYDPDPRGWSMFANLAARIQRGLNGVDGTPYRPMPGVAGAAFHGDSGWTPQAFMGQGALGVGLGKGKVYTDGRTDLQRETSTLLTDGPMRIYAARMQRTMGTGSVGGALGGS